MQACTHKPTKGLKDINTVTKKYSKCKIERDRHRKKRERGRERERKKKNVKKTSVCL